MQNSFFVTVEVQQMEDGAVGILHNAYDSQPQAESAFYGILQAAAVSSIPYHAAYIINDQGLLVGSKVYDRRTVETTAEEG